VDSIFVKPLLLNKVSKAKLHFFLQDKERKTLSRRMMVTGNQCIRANKSSGGVTTLFRKQLQAFRLLFRCYD